MTQAIQQVGAVHASDDMDGVNTPGAFTAFEDNTAIFCGDGSITCTQATGHFLDYIAQNDPTMAPFGGNPAGATLGARAMLQQNNQLGLQSPDAAVPRGELFHMDGKSLKQLLAPFADRLDELSAFVAQSSTGGAGVGGVDSATNQVLGKTQARGVGIPLV